MMKELAELEETKAKTERITERLRKRYHEEFIIQEFRNQPSGFTHRADMVVIYLHPSRGKLIEYFEIKALRADWLKELNSPSKSDGIAKHCDKIWLVTSEEDIAHIEEIPETWGWMYLKGQRLVVKKEAPLQEPTYDIDFIITLAQYTKSEFNNSINEAESKAYAQAKISAEQRFDQDYWKKEADRNAKKITEYEQKFKALEDALDVSNTYYMGLDYKNADELKEIGKILYYIYNLKEKKKENWRLMGFEKELKNIEEKVNVARNAVRKLRLVEVSIQDEQKV